MSEFWLKAAVEFVKGFLAGVIYAANDRNL